MSHYYLNWELDKTAENTIVVSMSQNKLNETLFCLFQTMKSQHLSVPLTATVTVR